MNFCDLFTASTNTLLLFDHTAHFFACGGTVCPWKYTKFKPKQTRIQLADSIEKKVHVGWTIPPGFVRWGVSFVLNRPPTSYWHNWTGLTTSWPLSIHQTPEGLTQISPETEQYVCHMRDALAPVCVLWWTGKTNLCRLLTRITSS